jgi:hypothetical protein
MAENKNAYKVLVAKPGGNRPLGKLTHRWDVNINMDLLEKDGIVWTNFTGSGLGPMAGDTKMNLRVP